jgi:hypothetical protein
MKPIESGKMFYDYSIELGIEVAFCSLLYSNQHALRALLSTEVWRSKIKKETEA